MCVRGRGEIKTREKDVENTCVTGRSDNDDGADDGAICPDRTSSNLLLVRVESECASLQHYIIIILSKRAAHAVPVNMNRRRRRRLFKHDILHNI